MTNAVFAKLSFGDLISDRNVLKWFFILIEKRNDRRIHPVDRSVLGAISKITPPYLSVCDGGPDIAYKFLRMVAGVDNSMVLANQFVAAVLRNFTELVINEDNPPALIGHRDDGGFV